MGGIRAQQVSEADFEKVDIFLAMDLKHLEILTKIKPAHSNADIMLFLEFSRTFSRQGVPDPYYGPENGFTRVLDMIEEGADTFLNQMYPQQPSV